MTDEPLTEQEQLWGRMLRAMRLEAGYGLREFAELIAVAPDHWLDIELGLARITLDEHKRAFEYFRMSE